MLIDSEMIKEELEKTLDTYIKRTKEGYKTKTFYAYITGHITDTSKRIRVVREVPGTKKGDEQC